MYKSVLNATPAPNPLILPNFLASHDIDNRFSFKINIYTIPALIILIKIYFLIHLIERLKQFRFSILTFLEINL